jgi:hypothetical protein
MIGAPIIGARRPDHRGGATMIGAVMEGQKWQKTAIS